MRFDRKHREILFYGLSMALLLFLLKWLEAHLMIFHYRLELLIGAMALLFTGLGICLALKLSKPKVQTLVVEKEVYRDPLPGGETDQREIEKSNLSKRELDVLGLMAKGFSNEEIAGQLFVSLNTVKTHSSNIYLKLDVKRRTQAVEKARRLNIIT